MDGWMDGWMDGVSRCVECSEACGICRRARGIFRRACGMFRKLVEYFGKLVIVAGSFWNVSEGLWTVWPHKKVLGAICLKYYWLLLFCDHQGGRQNRFWSPMLIFLQENWGCDRPMFVFHKENWVLKLRAAGWATETFLKICLKCYCLLLFGEHQGDY